MAATSSPLQIMSDAAEAAQTMKIQGELDLSGGKHVRFEAESERGHHSGRWRQITLYESKGQDFVFVDSVYWPLKPFGDALRILASRYPEGVLRPDTVKVSIKKGDSTGSRMQPIVIQAWYEAAGQPIPTLDDLAMQRKALKGTRQAAVDDAVARLKAGPSGVEEFNRLPAEERVKTDLRKADLAGADLSGIQLWQGTRMDGARLTGARLSKAAIQGCQCGDADFAGADLSGFTAFQTDFQGANFTGANLTGAHVEACNLFGADFTDATLTECHFSLSRYDEHTRWPKDFTPPETLQWKGTGADPRLASTRQAMARSKPTDFKGFLKRLEKTTDGAKLKKAMTMLQAERFRLFAQVQPDHVVGVVKSQSSHDLVYSCRLGSDGKYSCCTQNLNICGGLRGSPCKHLLVLIVGLTKAGELDPGTAHEWTQASRGKKAALDKDAMTETFLRYKGAEAGEVDWRPTETIPEDFYAM